ncbi:MAG: dockerin type I domain-containing protein [Christensenellales bacterium]
MKRTIVRLLSVLIAAIMAVSCSAGIFAVTSQDENYIYVLVDQPTSGNCYVMVSRQGGEYFAVSNEPMTGFDGLTPMPCSVAGEYVVSEVADNILWEFNASGDGFTVKSAANDEYLAKLNYSLATSPSAQQIWEHVIHTNPDTSIGDEPVLHNITAGGYILYRTHEGTSYFDCFNNYQQCNIRLYERREAGEDYIPVTGIEFTEPFLNLSLGSSYRLEHILYPANATIQEVFYESSDTDIARVNSDGTLITGTEGTCTVTIYDGMRIHSAECTVIVTSDSHQTPSFLGYRIYGGTKGIVSFDADNVADFIPEADMNDLTFLSAMCLVGDIIYGFEAGSGDHNLVTIDAETFERTPTNVYSGYYVRDMTYDAETGLIYCLMATNSTIYSVYYGLYVIDPETLWFQRIGEPDRYLSVLECTDDGRMYGIDMYGYLCTVNKETAECEIITRTAVTYLNQEQSLCFDKYNGRMYWMQSDDESGAFYEVNLASGSLSYLGYPGGDAIGYQCIVGLIARPIDEQPAYQLGDVNMDGSVNINDAVLVMRYSMGVADLSAEQIALADINGDASVNTGDAVVIMRIAMGI